MVKRGKKKGERTKQDIGHDVVQKKQVGGKQNLEGGAFFFLSLQGDEMGESKSTTAKDVEKVAERGEKEERDATTTSAPIGKAGKREKRESTPCYYSGSMFFLVGFHGFWIACRQFED